MKTIKVAAAVIMSENEQGEKVIFATERGYGDYKDWWEFPGGKLEAGETAEQALVREIREELNIRIDVNQFLMTVEHDYPAFHLSMDCFWAKIISGQLQLKEAEASRWLSKDQLDEVDWLPADLELIKNLK